MARTDTLPHFLTDVADAIRTKAGTSEPIQASSFDTAIENLPSGGGADLSEYFYTEITENTTSSSNYRYKTVKQYPDVIVADNVTSLDYCFQGLTGIATNKIAPKIICNNNVTSLVNLFNQTHDINTVDLSGMDTSNVTIMSGMFTGSLNPASALKNFIFGGKFNTEKVTNMQGMFKSARAIQTLDLSTFKTPALTNTYQMFYDCRGLTHLDIRNMTFDNVTTSIGMFDSNMPNDCEIIVKSETEKTWITSKFTFLTNVKTVSEYEGG